MSIAVQVCIYIYMYKHVHTWKVVKNRGFFLHILDVEAAS